MKKLIIVLAILMIITSMFAVFANKHSQETIDRIDAKIERYAE